MKKSFLLACVLIMTVWAVAQTTYLKFWQGDSILYQFDINEIDSLTFSYSAPQPEVVDLGLPSGTKWANMNLGALSPSDNGWYFQWGCTDSLTTPEWAVYCYGQPNAFTKYCTDGAYGNVDSLIYLQPEDDPATLILGDEWRTPTKEEIEELFQNCAWSEQTQDYIHYQGYRLIGENGNDIFIPYNGRIDLNGSKAGLGKEAYVWTSSLNESDNDTAWALRANHGERYMTNVCRAFACGIRPVRNEKRTMFLTPDSVKLEPGYTCHLTTIIRPKTFVYHNDDCTWTSSDTTVAVVSSDGVVTAKTSGTATITAQYDTLSAVCQVKVIRWIEDLTFTGAYFGKFKYNYNDRTVPLDTIYSASDGRVWYATPIQAYVALFTSGLYLKNHGQLTGTTDGGVIEFIAPIYWAPDWANNGWSAYLFDGSWNIRDIDSVVPMTAPTGKTNADFISNMKLYLTNLIAGDTTAALSYLATADSTGCEGMVMRRYTYHTIGEGYPNNGYFASELPVLFFTEGTFEVTMTYEIPSIFMNGISSHHLVAKPLLEQQVDSANFYHYGCYWHYDVTTGVYNWNDENVHWGTPYTYDYQYNTGASAPDRKRGQFIEIPYVGDIQTTRKIIENLHNLPKDHKNP